MSTVDLGTAANFGVLAGSTVTNTGPTQVINGDVGVSPGSAVVGFPPGTVTGGTIHAADAVAAQAQTDLTAAYTDAATRTPTGIAPPDLGGLTFTPGVYSNATSIGITGTVTLDAQGDPNAVFIFQAGSTLITASGSQVLLINGASACNVFWQVGSSATLGTTSSFAGNILASESITATTGATIIGRLLASTAAVTLDSNVVNVTPCNIICYAGKSKIYAQNILTGTISNVNASEIISGIHKVYSINSQEFIPIKYNVVTGPTTRYMKIAKGTLGENQPSETFYVTSGHKILIDGNEIKAGKIPQAKRVKVKPENVYSIVTENRVPILVNNLAVMSYGYNEWLEYSKKRGILWRDNKNLNMIEKSYPYTYFT